MLRACAGIAVLVLALPARGGDLEVVRQRIVAMHTGAGEYATAPETTAAASAICSAAAALSDSIADDGHWPDLPYDDEPAGPWSVGTHYARVRTMAQALALPSCTLFHDAGMTHRVERALAYGGTIFFAGCERPGNWWWWNIGIPSSLGPTLVLAGDTIDPAVAAHAVDALRANVAAQTELSGANLADHAMNTLYVAVLAGDSNGAMQAKQETETVCIVEPTDGAYLDRDGIKADFSYHMHFGQLYTGGYGAVFIGNVARMADLLEGTAFALSPQSLAVFDDFLAYGIAWSLYGGDFDPSVLSRGQSRRGSHAGGALGALMRAARRDGPHRALLHGSALDLLVHWEGGFATEDAPLAAWLRGSGGSGELAFGHRVYPDSDFVIHRGHQEWYASVKMLSSRMPSGENTNDEGKRFSRQSDGRFVLRVRGDEYSGDVPATLDWARLPGTTVELTDHAADASYGPGRRDFVGSAGNGRNGVSAMDFEPFPGSRSRLTARKSWFFFDEAIVFLASGITCPSDNDVQTIIDQRVLSSPDALIVIDGRRMPSETGWTEVLHDVKWVWADGVGYRLLDPTDLHVSRLAQKGRWSDLGLGSSQQVSAPVFTLWIDHGRRPDGANAAYAVFPRARPYEATEFEGRLEIVSRGAADAVRDPVTGTMGIVFWEAGNAAGWTSDTPAVLWVNDETEWIVRIAVAEPTKKAGEVILEMPGRFGRAPFSRWIAVSSPDPNRTALAVPVSEGRSVVLDLQRVPGTEEGSCGCTGGPSVVWVGVLVTGRRRRPVRPEPGVRVPGCRCARTPRPDRSVS